MPGNELGRPLCSAAARSGDSVVAAVNDHQPHLAYGILETRGLSDFVANCFGRIGIFLMRNNSIVRSYAEGTDLREDLVSAGTLSHRLPKRTRSGSVQPTKNASCGFQQ